MKPEQIFNHWKAIRANLLETIDRFSEAELAYQPFASSWPAGQIMLHIADAEDGWLRYAVSGELDKWPEEYTLENYPRKAAILAALNAVHQRTEQYLAGLDEAQLGQVIQFPWGESAPLLWVLWHVVEHETHHRGELSLILGMLGKEGVDV